MSDERKRDPASDDPKVADNPRSTGGPEAIGEAAAEPDYDQPRRVPSTTSRRLSRDEFPEGPEKTQG